MLPQVGTHRHRAAIMTGGNSRNDMIVLGPDPHRPDMNIAICRGCGQFNEKTFFAGGAWLLKYMCRSSFLQRYYPEEVYVKGPIPSYCPRFMEYIVMEQLKDAQ